MRSLFFAAVLGLGAAMAQDSAPSGPAKPEKSGPDPSSEKSTSKRTPNLAPPRSDHVDASSLPDETGESSSKDTRIDLSPPPDDAKQHPNSSGLLMDEGSSGSGDTSEFHPWDPHKAAKDIEVGDFYFKRKNYKAAEDRYREALLYKDNDAIATFRLAQCLEKMDRPGDAITEYESYLKILPYGPEAANAKSAIQRLKSSAASAKPN